MKFRLQCRTVMLTYKSHIPAGKFETFKGVHKIWHEIGDTGYKHTHALLYYRKKFDTKSEKYFDIEDIHPNIKKVLTKIHWDNCKNYDLADKKKGSKFTIVKDTLTGNEQMWKGETRETIQSHTRWRDVINDTSIEESVQKHLQWAKECFKCKTKFNALGDPSKLTLRKWQKNIMSKLLSQNDREIIWVCDRDGAKGKSWLTDYILDNYDSIMFNSGKVADMAKAFDNEEIVVFDLPKSADAEFTPYRAMEMFKDGRIFSPKYDSGMKRFKKCKVIVFSNEMPNQKKLIEDRWNIIDISKKVESGQKVPPTSLNIKGEVKIHKKVKNLKNLKKGKKKGKIKIAKITKSEMLARVMKWNKKNHSKYDYILDDDTG